MSHLCSAQDAGGGNVRAFFVGNSLPADPSRSLLRDATGRIHDAIKVSSDSTERVQVVADRVFGCQPETPGIAAQAASASCAASELHGALDALVRQLAELSAQVGRLSEL